MQNLTAAAEYSKIKTNIKQRTQYNEDHHSVSKTPMKDENKKRGWGIEELLQLATSFEQRQRRKEGKGKGKGWRTRSSALGVIK